MKTLFAMMMLLALITVSGCWNTSNQGGSMAVDEEFSITVPSSSTVKQGEETTITVALNRGAYFKQDVQLDLKAEGITVTPKNIMVKASEKPDVRIQIMAAKTAALGDYLISVKGTPTNGQPTATTFTVKVVLP